MKRIAIYLLILIAVMLIPAKKMDIRDLEPIQVVWLHRENNHIVLETDTGDRGVGEDVGHALENMKQLSSGIVYLDTAQFLLISENAKEHIIEIKPYLKEKVRMCLWNGGDLQEAARYMQSHKTGIKLAKWEQQVILPKLPI